MGRADVYRQRAVLGFGGVLACAALLLFGLTEVFNEQDARMARARAEAVVHTVPVVVASTTLYPGFEIRAEDLEIVQMDPEVAPADVSGTVGQLVGRIPAERMLPRDPVREARLASFGESRGLAALIPNGLRALSLDLRNAPAGAGFLLPGDRVDVHVTASADAGLESFVLLENVAVLAVDGSMTEETRQSGEKQSIGKQSPAITLLLTPEEAVKATHAHREGVVALALRSRIDLDQVATTAVNMRDLLGRNEVIEPRRFVPNHAEPNQGREMFIIRGPDVETVTFPVTEGESVGL
ncbi:MAG: Flp pilus assembly protein CpaB [Proteobacteria bacterium]|nr:Flp pilus assembly protein CpaB [Pseudomonadota bacterium]